MSSCISCKYVFLQVPLVKKKAVKSERNEDEVIEIEDDSHGNEDNDEEEMEDVQIQQELHSALKTLQDSDDDKPPKKVILVLNCHLSGKGDMNR